MKTSHLSILSGLLVIISVASNTGCSHASTSSATTPSTPSASPAHTSTHQAPKTSGLDVFKSIREGNERFVSGSVRHPHQDMARKSEMAKGQSPGAIVVSCSDSRVPPEVIFDQGLGDIFVVRSAGHAVEATDIASIEYAVEHLGSTLILVMGHTSCGAVKATLSTPIGKSAGSKNLDALVNQHRSMVGAAEENDQKFNVPVKRNVDATINQILKSSPLIAEKVQNSEVILARGVYDLDSGEVQFWGVAKP